MSKTPDVKQSRSMGSFLRRRPEIGAAIGFFAIWMLFAGLAPDSGFLTARGFASYVNIAAQVGIVATTVTLLLIAGEFDLSIGSVVAFAGMILALGITEGGWPLWLGLLVSFGFSILYGYVVGVLVVYAKIPSFIVTLAGLFLLRGLTTGFAAQIAERPYVSGVTDNLQDDPLMLLFKGSFFGGIDISVIWWIAILILAHIVLNFTRFGNWIYASGGSATAARASGVPVERVKIILFIVVAMSGALLAAVQVLSLSSADSFRGQGKEFEAAITAVIGGTSLLGGIGSVIGTAIGALTLGVLRQGLFFLGIDYAWYQAVLGVMLLLAVVINRIVHAKRRG